MRATTVVMTLQPFGCRDGSSENRVLRTNNIHTTKGCLVLGRGVNKHRITRESVQAQPLFPQKHDHDVGE